jgi:hypothetical protein
MKLQLDKVPKKVWIAGGLLSLIAIVWLWRSVQEREGGVADDPCNPESKAYNPLDPECEGAHDASQFPPQVAGGQSGGAVGGAMNLPVLQPYLPAGAPIPSDNSTPIPTPEPETPEPEPAPPVPAPEKAPPVSAPAPGSYGGTGTGVGGAVPVTTGPGPAPLPPTGNIFKIPKPGGGYYEIGLGGGVPVGGGSGGLHLPTSGPAPGSTPSAGVGGAQPLPAPQPGWCGHPNAVGVGQPCEFKNNHNPPAGWHWFCCNGALGRAPN